MSLNRVNSDGSITRVAGGSTASSSVFVGTTAEWAAETDKTDFDAALITDAGTVNAVDDTTGDTEVVANKHLVFKGTLEEWEALTVAEKKAYDEALITNDMDTGEVVDAVTDGDMRAVTSNAVYNTLVNTTIIQSTVKRSITRDPTQSTWYAASLQKPAIPAGKRLVRWLAYSDSPDIAVSVGSYNGDVDNCILVNGNIDMSTTPITFNIWWGAEIADC